MWKKNEETDSAAGYGATSSPQAASSEPASRPASGARASSGSPATIGESIRVQGEIRGSEDLLIEGEVDGQIQLDKHSVTVGRSGRVKADIHGGVLVVEGKVQGNLFAHEQVVVRASGEVRGNITSPRVSLEDGAKFKGSIDMEPRSASGGSASSSQESRKGDSGGSSAKGSGSDAGQGKDSSGGSSSGGGSASAGSSQGGSSGGKGGNGKGGNGKGGNGHGQKQRSGAAAS